MNLSKIIAICSAYRHLGGAIEDAARTGQVDIDRLLGFAEELKTTDVVSDDAHAFEKEILEIVDPVRFGPAS